jgi:hypothetical protein
VHCVDVAGNADDQVAALEHRLSAQDERHPGYAAAWRDFTAIVLSHGGRYVVPPSKPDVMIGTLGDRGRLAIAAALARRTAHSGWIGK